MLDIFEAGQVSLAGGVTSPACIVSAWGEYSLETWFTRKDRLPAAAAAKVSPLLSLRLLTS